MQAHFTKCHKIGSINPFTVLLFKDSKGAEVGVGGLVTVGSGGLRGRPGRACSA